MNIRSLDFIMETDKKRYGLYSPSIIRVDRNKTYIQAISARNPVFLEPSEVDLLLSCRNFRSLTTHAEHYCRLQKLVQIKNRKGLLGRFFRYLWAYSNRNGLEISIQKKEIAPFRQKLEKWAEEGLLVSEADLKNDIIKQCRINGRKQEKPAAHKISVVGIPTCGRPKTLKRCLESFTGNFSRHSRTPDMLILDDSRDESDQQENQFILRELNDRYTGRFYYLNRRRRKAFAHRVAQRAKVDPEIMEFALMGHPGCNRSEGGCRNAFLLLTQGRPALQTDDDTICNIAQLPTYRDELALTSEATSDAYWFFQSFQEALDNVRFMDEDFLGIHEQLLGKRPEEIISAFTDSNRSWNVEKMQPSFLKNMESRHARIRMTLPGPVGDTCLFSDLYRLFLEGESLQRLLYPEDDYPWHLTTRQVIRSVTRPTISDFPRCIGMNFAVDNRGLLPPFMPVQARCDGIFGDLLKVCFPGACGGNLPFLLAHNPPEKRPRTVDDVFSMLGQIRVNDIVSDVIFYSQHWPYTKDPEENLRTLGTFMMNLGSLTKEEFEQKIRQIVVSRTSRRIQMAEQHLAQQTTVTPYWAEHLQRFIQVLRDSLITANFLKPDDIDHPTSGEDEDFKDIVYQFGRVLFHWPDMYKAMEDFDEGELLQYATLFGNEHA